MTRRTDAPAGRECPHRHQRPHLDGLSTAWVMECYQEVFILREQLGTMEEKYRQRIAELEKTLLERDQKIAQLRLHTPDQCLSKVRQALVATVTYLVGRGQKPPIPAKDQVRTEQVDSASRAHRAGSRRFA